MTHILLTGGAGFIGSHTAAALLEAGHGVSIVDDFNDFYDPKQKEKNIESLVKKGAAVHRIDVRNEEAIRTLVNREKPRKIIHLAARAGVRPSIQNPRLYEETNVKGTLNLLEAAKESGVEQFIFASSSSVYGNSPKIPFSEEDNVDHPISPYAATKKAGELLCHTYHHLYKIQATCLRFFTVYGPAGRPDMAPYLFTDAIFHGRPIKRFGDGSSERDYTYIGDIVQGILGAVNNPLPYEIINLGNHKTVVLNKLIATIEKHLGKKANIEACPEQPGDVKITYANIDKAQRLLNYQPKTDIETGMQQFIEWYLEKSKI